MALLAPHVNVNQTNMRGDTALSYYARIGREIECVRYLVNTLHADTTIKNACGQTAKDIALMKKNYSIAAFLDDPKPESIESEKRIYHHQLIRRAIFVNNIPLIRRLLLDFHVNLEENHDGINNIGTPLEDAVKSNHVAAVECLIRYGKTDQHRSSALIKAVEQKNLPIVRLLIEEGSVDPNTQDASKNTPLMLATIQNDLPMVEFLVTQAHADMYIRGHWSRRIGDQWYGGYGTAGNIARTLGYHEITTFFEQQEKAMHTIANERQQAHAKKHARRCCTLL